MWLSHTVHNSNQNALHFHTPNPNQDNFPFKFDDYTGSGEVPASLALYMKKEYGVGVTYFAGDTWYAVSVRERGPNRVAGGL